MAEELKAAGLRPADIKDVLPDWADDALLTNAGQLELRSFIGKHFGLVFNLDGMLVRKDLPDALFKTSRRTDFQKIQPARFLCSSVAKIVSSMTIPKWNGTGNYNSEAIRQSIVSAKREQKWINFADLVEFLWSIGIPVVYIPKLPIQNKMVGMVTFATNRPIIFLTKKGDHSDWHLFDLAHEVGHIFKGHLPFSDGQAVVDEAVDDLDQDIQEKEANSFANELVSNSRELKIGTFISAQKLAETAIRFGNDNFLSPGHVILNAVNNSSIKGKKPYGLGNAALKIIDEKLGNLKTIEICKSSFLKNTDKTMIRSDSFEFLEKLSIL